MSHHKFRDQWENAHFIGTEKGMFVPGSGYYRGWGTTVGSDTVGGAAVQGWAPGALYIDTDAAAGAMLWINEGTAAAASWKAIPTVSTANTWALLQTFTLGLAVSSADLLTVGGVIVPQFFYVNYRIPKIAADVLYNCFIAPRACTVTRIDYVPRILQGGAMTVTPVKVTGTSAPSAGTTPLLTGTFDGNAGADTVQNGTLTATGADLVLATGNRLGVVLSTASTVGQAELIFTLKYS